MLVVRVEKGGRGERTWYLLRCCCRLQSSDGLRQWVRCRGENEQCISIVNCRAVSSSVEVLANVFTRGTGPRLDSGTPPTPRLDAFLFFSRHNLTSTNQRSNNPKKVNPVHLHFTIQQHLFQGRAGAISTHDTLAGYPFCPPAPARKETTSRGCTLRSSSALESFQTDTTQAEGITMEPVQFSPIPEGQHPRERLETTGRSIEH